MSDTKVLTPEQIAELRAALAKATPGPWTYCAKHPSAACSLDVDSPGSLCPVMRAVYPDNANHIADCALIAALRNAAPALLDAAERCGELERRFANLEMHSCAVAKAADRMRAHEKVQDEMLRAAIARAEAAEKERDRMRPVVEAAVAEYRAADAANDETEPDDCDASWLDTHDAIVHWHNGRVYIDVRRDDGLRVQANGTTLGACLNRAMELTSVTRPTS